ncbi:MAG TPA: polysaccharide deacetylase family protein [Bacilli bacterium]|nr:polysaccharide deacetylase family protein [Bacilli bacterium]
MRFVTKALFVVFIAFLSLGLIGLGKVDAWAYGWGFKKNDRHQVPDIGKYASVIEGTSAYYVGNPSKKEVYLTFDAGYDNGELANILAILREKKVKATFFLTGDFVNRFSDLCRQIVNDGHFIGNHSDSHKPLTSLSETELALDLASLEEKFFAATGAVMSKYFRPPSGIFDRESLLRLKKLGYKTCFWSIAYKDWDTANQRGADYSYESVIDNLHNGAIILMHSVSQSNREALGKIIDEIRNQGFTFKTVDEL